MSAEAENHSTAAEQKPETSDAPVENGAVDAGLVESTSHANEIAAAAQPQPVSEANGEQGTGDEGAKPANTTTDETSGAKVVAPVSTPASTKKSKDNKKRRSSTGIPEHKSKKSNPKKKGPELQLSAEAGDLFLATMKGFPKWPAIICDDEMLPESLLQNRPVTARRPDGSYREDFLEGGKNVRDRTYPIMYLGTYEFSWTVNTNLKPLTIDEARDANTTKMSQGLKVAYEEATEGHDLDHFKARLAEFQKKREEQIEEAEKKRAQAEAKKAKKSKKKAVEADDEDEDMPDADEEAPKSSKKRKAADGGENGESAKKVKISFSKGPKTPSTEAKAKTPKTKTPKSEKKAKPVEPPMSEAEKRDKKRQATLYCRHKLQKAFLTNEVPPKEEEMSQMAKFFDQLEKADDIDSGILKDTKIHKVMKGIVKLTGIPKDEEFHFKDRSAKLLDSWNKLLGESSDKPRPSTANGEKKEDGEADAKTDEKAESAEKDKKEEKTDNAEQSKNEEDSKAEGDDTAMHDAEPVANKDDKPAEVEDSKAGGEKTEGAESKEDEAAA